MPHRQLFRFVLAALVLALGALPTLANDGDFADDIHRAHGLTSWQGADALAADLEVWFGGQKAIEGTLTMGTTGGEVHLALADGSVLVYDGRDAWMSAGTTLPRARFHLLTWPYFVAAPMKITDPGTHLAALGDRPLRDGQAMPTARLTFGAGVGDSPDDWYILYRDPKTDHLAAMAYIVTYGTPTAEAEQEPHAITYHDVKEVGDGVHLATRWQFWNWAEDAGLVGEPIGRAAISNLRFFEPQAGTFERPVGAVEAPLP
ncbi:MAG: hypothetical protein AAGN46_02815 [Acidobacteriota bacterium]